MLVGIRHPEGIVAGAEYAQAVAEHFDGTTQILNPRDWQQYREAVVAYKPNAKKHLILLRTHHELTTPDKSDVKFRQTEVFFDKRGGSLFGVEPEVYADQQYKNTWIADLPDDVARVAKHATLTNERAKYVQKLAGEKYYGRTSLDPHTLLIGFTPRFNSISGSAHQIIGSLPEVWGNDPKVPTNWFGVGYLSLPSTDEKLVEILDWFRLTTNFVTLGENAHEKLESLEIEHGAVPMPRGNGRMKGSAAYSPYGLLLRQVARTGENRLDWNP